MPTAGGAESNPFLRYRDRLDSYRVALDGGMSDAEFYDLVAGLDAAVAGVWGRGFVTTPTLDGSDLIGPQGGLEVQVGHRIRLSVKVEVDQVSGSHKSRHLFGVAIHDAVAERLGRPAPDRMAIASCGNAALAAATVAAGVGRRLDVFVPTWADEPVVERLTELGAGVNVCERRTGEAGDPCYLRFREAVESGAGAFGVQGTDTPTTFDGGRTIGWEIADQVGVPDAAYVQVGGGALATSVALALPGASLYPVQAQGCAPLRQAWDRLAPDFDWTAARSEPDAYMTPWPDPTSAASGILDDITYDWLPLLELTRASGGHPIVVPEAMIVAAHERAGMVTGLSVSATGTAGYAGLLAEPPAFGERPGADEPHVVVLFTGVER